MFRLRSVRRKLALSLAFVVSMLLLQFGGGVFGLLSYRNVIQKLDRSLTDEPLPTQIVAVLSGAFEPLEQPATGGEEALSYRRRMTEQRLHEARATIVDYHRRLARYPLPPDVQVPTQSMLVQLEDALLTLLRDVTPLLSDPATSETAGQQLRQHIAHLQLRTLSLPRIDGHVGKLFAEARDTYRSCLWIVGIAGLVALGLFLGASRCLYLWIFRPIRVLYQGASRVALGDFTYRIQLPGQDEMSELADKLNSMTARFQDIKARLDNEVHERSRQLLRSERLAGVGFLAAGVAHEINNPLSAIAMAAESLETRLHEAEEAGVPMAGDDLNVLQQYLSMIQRESFRCQQITQRLLDFSRGQDAPRGRQDLTHIVGEVLDMVGHMSRFRGYEIIFDRSGSAWVEANPAEIKQVVLNLVANALESMEGTGRLEIDVAEHADEVVLTCRDNGSGMTPHVLENLFEPFFTERKSGRGTGLGLSISHRIISDHGGRIEALSDGPGRGSTFRVHLPRPVARARAA